MLNTRKKARSGFNNVFLLFNMTLKQKMCIPCLNGFLELDVHVTVAPVWTACSTNAPELR